MHGFKLFKACYTLNRTSIETKIVMYVISHHQTFCIVFDGWMIYDFFYKILKKSFLHIKIYGLCILTYLNQNKTEICYVTLVRYVHHEKQCEKHLQ